jgi:hypothetical protein
MSKSADIAHLFAHCKPTPTKPIRKADLVRLPAPVQQYLHYSQVVGKVPVQTVRLRQQGQMRPNPNGKWMPAVAEQYYTVYPPSFLWYARVKAAPLMTMAGRDEYSGGHGKMHIKLFRVYSLFNQRGREIDQGAMVRYLSEIIWFPTAWLSDYITWEAVDDHHARAIMHYAGQTVSGVLTFGEDGRFLSFEALRYRSNPDKTSSLQTWVATSNTYGDYDGIRVPTDGDVTWKLPEGDHSYFRARIFDLQYNCPERY